MTDTTILPESPEMATEVVAPTSAPISSERSSRPPRKPRDNKDRGSDEFQEEMLALDRVTRVTAGGRQLRFRASIVIGDGKGRVGLGIGKSGEVQGAIEKAVRDAKKNLITVPMIDGTIAHDVTVSFKSSSVFLHPAHPGTGIIAGGAVRKVLSVSGLKNVIAKQHGAPNKITNARVVIQALASLKPADRLYTKKATLTSTEKKDTLTDTTKATKKALKK